jgi:hypothetical protein
MYEMHYMTIIFVDYAREQDLFVARYLLLYPTTLPDCKVWNRSFRIRE